MSVPIRVAMALDHLRSVGATVEEYVDEWRYFARVESVPVGEWRMCDAVLVRDERCQPVARWFYQDFSQAYAETGL